jgi:hypothetical protein
VNASDAAAARLKAQEKGANEPTMAAPRSVAERRGNAYCTYKIREFMCNVLSG